MLWMTRDVTRRVRACRCRLLHKISLESGQGPQKHGHPRRASGPWGPLSLRPPHYFHATKMEAYYKAESDKTNLLDQAALQMHLLQVLRLESG